MTRSLFVAVSMALAATAPFVHAAGADANPYFVPTPDDVCVSSQAHEESAREKTPGIVDKAKLASWALTKYTVSRDPEDWAIANLQLTPRAARTRVISEKQFCKDDQGAGLAPCSKADRLAVQAAHNGVDEWLESATTPFDRTKIPDEQVRTFFSDSQLQMFCGAAPPEKPKDTNSMADTLSGFRIRGTTDALRFRQDDPTFKSLPNASLSISRDDFHDKTGNKLVGDIGYLLFESSHNGSGVDVVPYVGFNRDISTSQQSGANITANTRDVGVSINAEHVSHGDRQTDDVFDNLFIIRPDYLSDLQHHSHIESLNFNYMPVFSRVLNSYFSVAPDRMGGISLLPIFDVRLDAGHYEDCGSLPASRCYNYTRLGSQFGFALASDDSTVPITFNVTDTRLVGLSNRSHDIDYVKTALSYAINQSKTASLDLSYSNGRREDTALEEKLWSVSVGVKY